MFLVFLKKLPVPVSPVPRVPDLDQLITYICVSK